MLDLSLLTVPGCPNGPVMLERLAEVLADYPDARVTRLVVHDEADALRLGLHGSPTLLVNGIDPFSAPGDPASVSCRVYRGWAWIRPPLNPPSGRGEGRNGRRTQGAVDGRSGPGALAGPPAEGGLRAVQQRVLRSFAQTGEPPAMTELDQAAARYSTDGRAVLALLHAADFLRLDAAGAISAAYPFSAVPTPHVVQIGHGPAVFSMCPIDALGVAAMVGRSVTICSAEPGTGIAVTVTVPAGRGRAIWQPKGALVYVGRQDACGTCAARDVAVPSVAADVCCGFINFFASRASAAAWAAAHPARQARCSGA